MSTIIKCNKCGNEVSTSFISCPTCKTTIANVTPPKISIWVWVVVMFGIIIGLGLNGAEPITPPRSGTASFSKTYTFAEAAAGGVFAGDLWELATDNPQVNTICLSTTIQLGNNKYGNAVFGDPLTIVLYSTELNELRKYTTKDYARQSSLPPGANRRTCPTY